MVQKDCVIPIGIGAEWIGDGVGVDRGVSGSPVGGGGKRPILMCVYRIAPLVGRYCCPSVTHTFIAVEQLPMLVDFVEKGHCKSW